MNGFFTPITEYLIGFLKMVSWRMYTPQILGFVHAYSFIGIIFISIFAAVMAGRMSEKKRLRLLTILGWVMVIMEIFKQLFYFFIVNDGAYDFWLLPFQLCSVPMYMCVLLPFVKKKTRDTLLTFMAGFTFVSAMAALIYPADMLKPYIVLTAHGFIWHGILLFISLLIGISGMGDFTWKGFLRSSGLFIVLALFAVLINVLTEPLAKMTGVQGSYPNMFYLSPYHMSNQPFVTELEQTYGRLPAMGCYVLAIIVLAGIVDFVFWLISRNR